MKYKRKKCTLNLLQTFLNLIGSHFPFQCFVQLCKFIPNSFLIEK